MISMTIVTPTKNQAATLPHTIESVLTQDTEGLLEYIIVDACSTDATPDIVQQYVPTFQTAGKKLVYIREPDKGQSDAINKGWRRSQGRILGYLNSDDYYEGGALGAVESYFLDHPEVCWAYGGWRLVDAEGNVYTTKRHSVYRHRRLLNYCDIGQPSCFLRRELLDEVGFLNPAYHLAMDYELWLRIAQRHRAGIIPEVLSCMRYHADAKSGKYTHAQALEVFRLGASYTHPCSVRRVVQMFYLLRSWLVVALGVDVTRRIAGRRTRTASSRRPAQARSEDSANTPGKSPASRALPTSSQD